MALPEVLIKYAKRLGFTDPTTSGYQTLERVFQLLYLDKEEHAGVVCAIPGTPQEIVVKSGLPEEVAKEVIQRLIARGGLIGYAKRPGQLAFPANIGNLKELNSNWPEASKEFHALMDVLFYDEIHKDSEMLDFVRILDEASVVRVLPVDEAVHGENRIMHVDSARAIFDDVDVISAVPCGCRVQARANDRGLDCKAPDDVNVCMQTNAYAAHILKRGIGGEELTPEEARKRVGIAEDAGLIHMVANVVPKDRSYILCNCCSCCCAGMYWINSGHKGIYAPSRFTVRMDADACSGCGTCEEWCQFGHIKMNEEDTPAIAYDDCYGCGNCVTKCPENALRLEEVRTTDHIHEEDTYFS